MTDQLDLADNLLRATARLDRWANRQATMEHPQAQLRVLALIDDRGPSRVCDLAKADHASQPSTTAMVDKMASAGWVSRTPDPSDARATLIASTEAGQAALQDARARRAAALSPAVENLDPQQQQRLREASAALADLLSVLSTLADDTHTKEA